MIVVPIVAALFMVVAAIVAASVAIPGHAHRIGDATAKRQQGGSRREQKG
jgi:hypothetical protein